MSYADQSLVVYLLTLKGSNLHQPESSSPKPSSHTDSRHRNLLAAVIAS